MTPVETYYAGYDGTEHNYISYTDINIHYVFGFWGVELVPFGGLKTWFIPSSSVLGGRPFCDIYTIGLEVHWGDFSITADHYCAHSVYSTKDMWKVKDYRMGQNMNEIKIRYSFN